MAQAAQRVPGVTLVDLYAEYPDFNIDIDREQARLLEHDIIVFQYPLYWYSTPSILKEWQDLVLEYGFAYGTGGHALEGKLFFSAISAGGLSAAYRADGFNHFTLRELLHPLEQMAVLCGMRYLPPFALFGSRTALEDGRVRTHVNDWVKLLSGLQRREIRASTVTDLTLLNEALTETATEA